MRFKILIFLLTFSTFNQAFCGFDPNTVSKKVANSFLTALNQGNLQNGPKLNKEYFRLKEEKDQAEKDKAEEQVKTLKNSYESALQKITNNTTKGLIRTTKPATIDDEIKNTQEQKNSFDKIEKYFKSAVHLFRAIAADARAIEQSTKKISDMKEFKATTGAYNALSKEEKTLAKKFNEFIPADVSFPSSLDNTSNASHYNSKNQVPKALNLLSKNQLNMENKLNALKALKAYNDAKKKFASINNYHTFMAIIHQKAGKSYNP